MQDYRSALIVGAGDGLSASLARLFAAEGLQGRAGRSQRGQAARAGGGDRCRHRRLRRRRAGPGRSAVRRRWTRRSAGRRTSSSTMPARAARGPLVELDPATVANALRVSAFGGFLVAQQAARRMLPRGKGAILLTGASASVKGYKLSAPFAMGKFALRGLAQSIARELAPQGIHVAHFVIDGAIRNPGRTESAPGFDARSRRHRTHLPPRPAAGPQRLDLGGRAAPLGRELLAAAAQERRRPPRRRRPTGRSAAAWRAISLPASCKGASRPSRASRAAWARRASAARSSAITTAASSPASSAQACADDRGGGRRRQRGRQGHVDGGHGEARRGQQQHDRYQRPAPSAAPGAARDGASPAALPAAA